MKWEDIDFKKKSLTVKRTLIRVKGGYQFGDPKTKKTKRTIPLPEAVYSEGYYILANGCENGCNFLAFVNILHITKIPKVFKPSVNSVF